MRPDLRERCRHQRRRQGRWPRLVDILGARHRRDQADRGDQGHDHDIAAPAGAIDGFVAVDIAGDTYPTWKTPVRAFSRQDGGGWKLVGLERMGDDPARTTGPTEGGEWRRKAAAAIERCCFQPRTSRSASAGNRKRSSTRRVAAARFGYVSRANRAFLRVTARSLAAMRSAFVRANRIRSAS